MALSFTVAFDELVDLLAKIFRFNGCDTSTALVLARNCASAQRDGSVSHGVFRMSNYISTLRSGYVNGCAVPIVKSVSPGLVRVDAANGFAQTALKAATGLLLEKVAGNAIAVMAIHGSHHLGALYLDVEPFAELGYVAIAMTNSIAVVAPPGGLKGVYGTNPIAFATPRANGPPLVFDLACSAMAHGDVQIAQREGRKLPPGTGINAHGELTCEPEEILRGGALLPFGGHKGANIALMIEILCAAFGGGDFSHEVDWSSNPGAMTARTGFTLILIDPSRGASELRPFALRIEHLIQELRNAGQTHIPGERRTAFRQRLEGRVTLSEADWTKLLDLQ